MEVTMLMGNTDNSLVLPCASSLVSSPKDQQLPNLEVEKSQGPLEPLCLVVVYTNLSWFVSICFAFSRRDHCLPDNATQIPTSFLSSGRGR
jgi:hypothetical protein